MKINILAVLFFSIALNLYSEIQIDSARLFLNRAKQSPSVEDQIILSKKALQQGLAAKDTLLIGDIYNFLGFTYQKIGDYENGINYYLKAYELFKPTNNLDGLSNTLNNLGVIYGKTEHLNKALSYFREVINIKKKIYGNKTHSVDYKKFLAGSYNNVALIQDYMGEHDSAVIYLNKSLELYNQINDTFGIAETYSNLAITYLNKNNHPIAEENFLKAYYLSNTLNKIEFTIDICYNLSEFYFIVGDINKAEKYLEQCYQDALTLNQRDLIANIYELKAKISFKKQEYKNAYLYQSQFKAINDSLINDDTRARIAQLQIIHEVQRKEEEINLLLNEKQLAHQRIRFNQMLLLTVAVILIVSLILSYVFFKQNSKLLTSNKELVKRNLEIISMGKNHKEKVNNKYASSALSDTKRHQVLMNLEKLMDVNQTFLKKDLTIETAASALSISRTYLSQIVNETFNSNFTNYINDFRIDYAIQLISDPDNKKYSIAGIAELSGFHSISSFNTHFKQKTGLTPSTFRKIALNK